MSFIAAHAPVIGLIFFFVFFLGVVVYLLQPNAKKKMANYAMIPLENNDE
jgi:cbb3-type cytochrome oxidase subunit 3